MRKPQPAPRNYPGTAEDRPESDHHIHLREGEQKIEVREIAKDTAIFKFNKEDHTLGNLISAGLLKYDFILFSAYKMEGHNTYFTLRVQTDGSISPEEAVRRFCEDKKEDKKEGLGLLFHEFKVEPRKFIAVKQKNETPEKNLEAVEKEPEGLKLDEDPDGAIYSTVADC